MNQSIEITDSLYERLEAHAEGFDTPAWVIERMVDFYERENNLSSTHPIIEEKTVPAKLEIVYFPVNDENNFKELLLEYKKAYIKLYKVDGKTEIKEWNASSGFERQSSVNGNLRSGYLRGWKNKGIYKVKLSTNKSDLEQ